MRHGYRFVLEPGDTFLTLLLSFWFRTCEDCLEFSVPSALPFLPDFFTPLGIAFRLGSFDAGPVSDQ